MSYWDLISDSECDDSDTFLERVRNLRDEENYYTWVSNNPCPRHGALNMDGICPVCGWVPRVPLTPDEDRECEGVEGDGEYSPDELEIPF